MTLVRERSKLAFSLVAIAAVAGLLSVHFGWIALAAVAGVVVAFFALSNPTLALYLLIFSIPLTEVYQPGEQGGVAITFVTTALLFAAILVALPKYIGRDNLNIGTGWAWYAAMLFLSLPGLLVAVDIGWSLNLLTTYFKFFLLFIAVAFVIRTKEQLERALIAFVLGTVVQGAILVSGFLPQLVISSAFRLSGANTNPNSIATYVIIAVPAAMYFLSEARGFYSKAGLLLAIFLLSFVSVAIQSRSAWLAFVLYIVWYAIVRQRKNLAAALGIIAGVALFLLLVDVAFNDVVAKSFQKRISLATTRQLMALDESYNLRVRLENYKVAAAMIPDNLLIGVGVGNYSERAQEYGREMLPSGFELNTHNTLLEVLTGSGIAAALCMLFVFTSSFGACMRVVRENQELRSLALLLAVIVVLVFMHSMFHVVLHMRPVYIVLGFAGALAKISKSMSLNRSVAGEETPPLLVAISSTGVADAG